MRRLTEYETKLVFMNQEMERLSSTSRLLAQENDNLKRQLKQREGSMNQYEAEMTRKVQLYEQSLSAQQH